MANGSEDEIRATDDAELSDFFKGGKGDYIHSIVTLAAPHNGTTAYMVDENDVPKDDNALSNIKTDIQTRHKIT